MTTTPAHTTPFVPAAQRANPRATLVSLTETVRALARQHPNRIAYRDGSRCVYQDTVTGQPVDIIGHALAVHDMLEQVVATNHNHIRAKETVAHVLGLSLEQRYVHYEPLLYWLDLVQLQQDRLLTWERAVELTDSIAPIDPDTPAA